MTDTHPTITLHYMPHTRATGTRVLLEELGVPYDLHVMNMKKGENRQPAYLAINPLGKVPALTVNGTLVTEQAAIALYLADLFPEAGLAPTLTAPERGTYVRFLVFYNACFEPALIDRYLKRDTASQNDTPYADYNSMLSVLRTQLAKAPFLTGDTMTAADILWGVAFSWTLQFGLVPDEPVFRDFSARITSRPAFQTVSAEDDAMAARHAQEAAKV
ncbi:glutathione S-transferase [Rhizobium sp. RU20A]|uniref:glutathione S-transferase family protein n=1 Tax=Rhizobium sp. RU20A TaxID=1907412 RepID=UPI0009570C02|nr:glutathione S-transferase family protein [Rhizobium sp. RU20A]SIP96203.1 glutathione S-transferase [Rhizobium sp. RU20A]